HRSAVGTQPGGGFAVDLPGASRGDAPDRTRTLGARPRAVAVLLQPGPAVGVGPTGAGRPGGGLGAFRTRSGPRRGGRAAGGRGERRHRAGAGGTGVSDGVGSVVVDVRDGGPGTDALLRMGLDDLEQGDRTVADRP